MAGTLTIEAEKSYRSVHGQVENLFELWHTVQRTQAIDGVAVVMNEVAPHFFGTLHRCALQCVLILIRQLTEPATTSVRGARRLNSSMLGLLHVTFGEHYCTVVPQLTEIVERAERVSSPAREWANKLIAHTDLAVGVGDESLPPLAWANLSIAVGLTTQFIQQFEATSAMPVTPYANSVLTTELVRVETALRAGSAALDVTPLSG